MFTFTEAFPSFSVDNLEKAKQFYSQVLQLEITEDTQMHLLQLHIADGTKIIIYPKPNHAPATFTILNFPVDNIEEAVAELKSRGVTFESYHEQHLQTDHLNISRSEAVQVAWFKDLAGNILSVNETKKDK